MKIAVAIHLLNCFAYQFLKVLRRNGKSFGSVKRDKILKSTEKKKF